MAKGKKSKLKDGGEPRIVNRRARHEYEIRDTLECGIVLLGSEVKSVRMGQVSLVEGYALIDEKNLRLLLRDVNIARYPQAGAYGHVDPKRERVLLAHKQEIRQLIGKVSAKGVTLVPTAMYFVRGRVKVEIGIAIGKQAHDKRESIKEREMDREIRRAMSKRV